MEIENEKTFFLTTECALLCVFALTMTSCGHSLTEVQHAVNMEAALHTAVMYDKNQGYAVGMQGRTRYTEDGGKTWQNGKNKSPYLFSICLLNNKECVAAGNGSTIVQSVDYGRTWKNLKQAPAGRARGISFCELTKGWVWSRIGLYETRNNSESWERIELPQGEKIVETAYMTAEKKGFIVSGNGFLYRLNNGTWEQIIQVFDKEDKNFTMIYAGDYQQVAMTFSKEDNKTGYIALSGNINNKAVLKILKTTDGGTTWTTIIMQEVNDKPMTMCFNANMELSTLNINETLSTYRIK